MIYFGRVGDPLRLPSGHDLGTGGQDAGGRDDRSVYRPPTLEPMDSTSGSYRSLRSGSWKTRRVRPVGTGDTDLDRVLESLEEDDSRAKVVITV